MRIPAIAIAACLCSALLLQVAPSAEAAEKAKSPKSKAATERELMDKLGTQFSGKYRLSQPRHTGKVNKIDSFTVKQGTRRAFNPKEFKLDDKAQWKKAPKSKSLCTTPDGKPRAC